MNEEILLGRLCEKGYLKERYDYEKEDLVKEFTSKGKEEVKKLLKKKEYQKFLISLLKQMPLNLRINVVNNIREFLKWP